jgi:hypothetical protein
VRGVATIRDLDRPDPTLDELRAALARWDLGLLAPESVPALAVAALGRGCAVPEIAVLAGLRAPLRADIEDELPDLLRRVGWSRPTREEAIKTVADDIATQIVDGAVAATDGAHDLWQLANLTGFGGPIWTQLSLFVGLASEWDDHKAQRPTLETAIVDAARQLLASGGVRLAPSA